MEYMLDLNISKLIVKINQIRFYKKVSKRTVPFDTKFPEGYGRGGGNV